MEVFEEKLSVQELSELKKDLRVPLLNAVLFSLFLGAGLHIYIINYEDHPGLLVLESLYAALLTIIFIITSTYTKKIRLDIKGGKKKLIKRELTDKKAFVVQSQALGPPRKRYFFHFDDVVSRVTAELYNEASVGDKIITLKAPNTGKIFDFLVEKNNI